MKTKKNLLFSFTLLFLALYHGAYAQVVNIAVSPDPISKAVVGGNTVMETITISNSGNAPLDWSLGNIPFGDPLTFTKEDYVDWNLPENQDRISSNVWLTR